MNGWLAISLLVRIQNKNTLGVKSFKGVRLANLFKTISSRVDATCSRLHSVGNRCIIRLKDVDLRFSYFVAWFKFVWKSRIGDRVT